MTAADLPRCHLQALHGLGARFLRQPERAEVELLPWTNRHERPHARTEEPCAGGTKRTVAVEDHDDR